jgi:truncated hemoglobin YjbI
MTTPYERIGGAAVAQAALDDFFQRAQADALLNHLIGPVVSPGARAFAAAALDLDSHDEATLAPALAWLSEEGLEDDDLDHMVGHLVLALEAQGLDDDLVAEIADHAESLRDAALGVWPEDGDEDEDEAAA